MIYGIWNFLINEATPEYIMSLDADLIDLEDCEYPPAMRDLIGFWFGRGNAWPSRRLAPKNLLNKSGHRKASYWGEQVKQRIARQLPKIKRWQVIEGDYSDAPDIEAFWLVDPPYFKQGKHYNYNNSSIDYEHLAEWCLNRRGAGLVCEAEGASWLPFEPLRNIQTQRNDSRKEYVYWLNKKADYSDLFE